MFSRVGVGYRTWQDNDNAVWADELDPTVQLTRTGTQGPPCSRARSVGRNLLSSDPMQGRFSKWAIGGVLALLVTGANCNPQVVEDAKDVGRTVNDAAAILCHIFGEENPEHLQGINPAAWCKAYDNIAPFIDQVLAAQQSATQLSLARGTDGGVAPE